MFITTQKIQEISDMEKTYTIAEIAEMLNATVKGTTDNVISGVDSLRLASENCLSFLSNAKYTHLLPSCKAKVIIVPSDFEQEPEEGKTFLVCENPDKAFSKVCALFAPPAQTYVPGIDPTAVIAASAKLGENVSVGPNAVIDENCEIGNGCVIRAGAYIGPNSKIGEKTVIHPNVSIMHSCIIGKRCILHAGTTIGADGFGYTPSFRGLVKVPQNGIVQIDDDVEIGANCTIDRARFSRTWIKKGVKIDNLVHVAHNVIVGESTALIGQCGIAGSAVIGRGCAIGAGAGINGHIELGDGTKVIGPSAVQKSTNPGETVIGVPAESEKEFFERHLLPRKVKRMAAKIEELETLVKKLSKQLEGPDAK